MREEYHSRPVLIQDRDMNEKETFYRKRKELWK